MATPGRTRLKGEERRQLILEAARRVFLETGFAGARTRRIAEEAGITEALLYRFFPSKLAIYEAAVLQPLEAFVAQMLAATGEIEASSDDQYARAVCYALPRLKWEPVVVNGQKAVAGLVHVPFTFEVR